MRCFHFDTVDSTSTRAAALAPDYPNEPIVVAARIQTAGRGRAGRPWHAPVGGAWFTLAWPTDVTPAHTSAAPILAGLGVLESVAALCEGDNDLRLKWPNDVLLDGRKLAGVLCEQQIGGPTAPRTVLVGVGINANLDAATLGGGLRLPATSLRAVLGRDVALDALIDDCAGRIASLLGAMSNDGLPEPLLGRIHARLAWRGQQVSLEQAGARCAGLLHGVDSRGRARIGERVFEAGEVSGIVVD